MRFGVYAPISNRYSVDTLVELAMAAEDAGWEGFFIWDNLQATFDGSGVTADTTVALASIATATERLRFGALVTPLPRRRPWKFAKETATLDHLSGGRLTVGVGLGGREDFEPFGERVPMGERARMLDEALEVVSALWSGGAVDYDGEHFTLRDASLAPPPLQAPRIPIWVGGYWPGTAPFRRAARWDGVAPVRTGELFSGLSPAELAECVSYVKRRRRSADPFDVAHFQVSSPPSPGAVEEYEAAGATWWLEATDPARESVDEFRRRVLAGPPAA